MDAQKVLEALDVYATKLDGFIHDPIRNERCDTSKKYPVWGSSDNARAKLNHTRWAIDEARRFVAEGRMEKAFRWLGFIQGVVWFQGLYAIDDLANHNKPVSEEMDPDHSLR
jgi:hypothetical protein